MAWTDNRLQERFDSIDRRFDEIDRRFEQVDRRFEQVDKRFEQVDKRFEQVDKRFEQVDRRFDHVEAGLRAINMRLDGLQRTMVQAAVAMSASFIAGFAALIGLVATQL